MIDRRIQRLVFSCLLSTTLLSCADKQEAELDTAQDQRAATVYVVNYPLAYFAERIGGESFEIVFPAPADVDPADWSPAPEVIAEYQRADLILLNGADYAKWIQRATLPRSKIVDTSAAFQDRYIRVDESVTHAHGPEGEHAHTGVAFTTWLDPLLAIEQARAIAAAFGHTRPEARGEFESGFAALEADLRELDSRLEAVTESIGDKPILFSHPVYQYLERRYGLNGHSLHWEPDQFPDERDWRALEALLEEHGAHWMLWEAAPLEETARRLDSMGIASLVYHPVANAPEAGDFMTVMKDNVERLELQLDRENAP